MDTLDQKRNREMAHILMVICLLSMLRQWRVKQEKYEKWEKENERANQPQRTRKQPTHSIMTSLMTMLGIE